MVLMAGAVRAWGQPMPRRKEQHQAPAGAMLTWGALKTASRTGCKGRFPGKGSAEPHKG